jgi:hypothetical protein
MRLKFSFSSSTGKLLDFFGNINQPLSFCGEHNRSDKALVCAHGYTDIAVGVPEDSKIRSSFKLHNKKTHCLITVSIHEEFASGTFLQASAVALIIKSLTLILTPSPFN